jgi:hypothetical protein
MDHDSNDAPYQADGEEEEEEEDEEEGEEECDPSTESFAIRPHGRSKHREITKEKLTTVGGGLQQCLWCAFGLPRMLCASPAECCPCACSRAPALRLCVGLYVSR